MVAGLLLKELRNEEMNYLVYKISGGLNHMLGQINNAIYASKITNRFLIIDCNELAFNNDFNKYFNVPDFNYATNYDALYKDNSLDKNLFEPYINAKRIRGADGWTYLLNGKKLCINFKDIVQSTEKIIYCTAIHRIGTQVDWFIKVNKDIVDIISANKINEIYIGVHYRNTDMKHNLEDFVPQILKLSKVCQTIYLGTDDHTAFSKLNNLLNNKFKIIQYTKPIDAKGHNIHYGNPNKDEVIINALIDMYHLMHSTYFLPSTKSSFSIRIEQLRINDNFFK